MRTTLLAYTMAGLVSLLTLGEGQAANNLINIDVQSHGTSDANTADLGVDPDFIPGTNRWVGVGADGVPSLIDFDGTDPVDLSDDIWNFVNLTDIKDADTAGNADGFQDAPTPLSYITGTASGMGFEFTSSLADLDGGVRNDDTFTFEADDVVRDEIHNIPDIIGGTGLTIDWKLSGLDASGSTTYDVYVIASNIYFGGWSDVEVTHGGGSEIKQLTSPNNGGVSVKYIDGPLRSGGDYQEFLGVTADANGDISGFVRDFNDGGGERYFSGIQLVEHTVVLPQAGDYNADGTVDAADYTVWRDNEGAGDESSLNGNGDGLNGVDAGDYTLWVNNFGSSSSSSTAVPEPSALLIVVCALSMMRINRR